MRIPLDRQSTCPFTNRSKIICARASFRGAWQPIRACRPVASWRVTWALTASPWRTPIPSWKQMDWSSPAWAAAPMFCRPIRSRRIPKTERRASWPLWQQSLPGQERGHQTCRDRGNAQSRRASQPDQLCQRDQRFAPLPGRRIPQNPADCHAPGRDRSDGLWRAQRICALCARASPISWPARACRPARKIS